MGKSDHTEHIARISKGKDSLKMLDVIWTRGLPLDRITTTEVWATDTVSAYLPEMQAFMDRMDQWIWERYHIECEHLCARNKDGSKKTYEQMFYHIPNRRSQTVQVEREREADSGPARSSDSRTYGTRGVKLDSNGMPSRWAQGRIKGFPGTVAVNWCQKLKLVPTPPRLPRSDFQLVQEAQDRLRPHPPFPMSAPRGAGKQISWNISGLQQMNRPGLDS